MPWIQQSYCIGEPWPVRQGSCKSKKFGNHWFSHLSFLPSALFLLTSKNFHCHLKLKHIWLVLCRDVLYTKNIAHPYVGTCVLESWATYNTVFGYNQDTLYINIQKEATHSFYLTQEAGEGLYICLFHTYQVEVGILHVFPQYNLEEYCKTQVAHQTASKQCNNWEKYALHYLYLQ